LRRGHRAPWRRVLGSGHERFPGRLTREAARAFAGEPDASQRLRFATAGSRAAMRRCDGAQVRSKTALRDARGVPWLLSSPALRCSIVCADHCDRRYRLAPIGWLPLSKSRCYVVSSGAFRERAIDLTARMSAPEQPVGRPPHAVSHVAAGAAAHKDPADRPQEA